MFGMESKEKEVKESVLEKLIEHLLSMDDSEGSPDEEKSESPEMESIEDKLGGEKLEKPKLEMKVLEVKSKPKFTMPDGSEAEDESIEDLLKRKKLEG